MHTGYRYKGLFFVLSDACAYTHTHIHTHTYTYTYIWQYFESLQLSPRSLKGRLKHVSRHRHEHVPPRSPDGFWDVGFPDTEADPKQAHLLLHRRRHGSEGDVTPAGRGGGAGAALSLNYQASLAESVSQSQAPCAPVPSGWVSTVRK